MKKFSKKGILLFAAAMALCAFAMPSMAGAASWTVVGTEHTLDTGNVGFEGTSAVLGTITSQCTSSSFTTTVASSANLEITAATFGGQCTAHGPAIGTCVADAVAQKLPWTATAVTTSNIQIHGIHINVAFTQTTPTALCNAVGSVLTITGTVSGGAWNNAARHLTLDNEPGLTSHTAGFPPTAVNARGTFRDTQQTLQVD
jgi:hypothetical protein